MQFAVNNMKIKIKTIIRDFLLEQRIFFYKKSKKSSIVIWCILILGTSVVITGSSISSYHGSVFMIITSFLGNTVIAYFGSVVARFLAYLIVTPYAHVIKRNDNRKKERAISSFKANYDKEIQIRNLLDKEIFRKQQEEFWLNKISEEKKKLTEELHNDDFKKYSEFNESIQKRREEILKEYGRRVNTVITYTTVEMPKFGFESLEIKYIQETLKTFIVTNGNYKETSESPLKNKYKGDKRITRGRNAKQFWGEPILTQMDIASFSWNIANHLHCKVTDVAALSIHMFSDWFNDGSAESLAKMAKNDSSKGNIVRHEDLEAYLKELNAYKDV